MLCRDCVSIWLLMKIILVLLNHKMDLILFYVLNRLSLCDLLGTREEGVVTESVGACYGVVGKRHKGKVR